MGTHEHYGVNDMNNAIICFNISRNYRSIICLKAVIGNIYIDLGTF